MEGVGGVKGEGRQGARRQSTDLFIIRGKNGQI